MLRFCIPDVENIEKHPSVFITDEKVKLDFSVCENAHAAIERYREATGISGLIFLPVYNSEEKLCLLAFEDRREDFDWIFDYVRGIARKSFVPVSRLFPKDMYFVLNGMNELSIYFCLYLAQNRAAFQTRGFGWDCFDFSPYSGEVSGASGRELEFAMEDGLYFSELYKGETLLDGNVSVGQLVYNICWDNYRIAAYLEANKLKHKNISIYTVGFPTEMDVIKTEDENQYYRTFSLEKLSDEEEKSMKHIYGEKYVDEVRAGASLAGRYSNIRYGMEFISVIKEERRAHVYLIGPCTVQQIELVPQDTLIGKLQTQLDHDFPDFFKVCGVVVLGGEYDRLEQLFQMVDLYDSDLVVFIFEKPKRNSGIPYIDLLPFFSERQGERWFADMPIHLNAVGSIRIAEHLYGKMHETFSALAKQVNPELLSMGDFIEEDIKKGVDTYIRSLKISEKDGICGAIVMNCNPYTNGHDYLIRTAVAMVDHLYIFVVEEDLSVFPFQERIDLVRKNVEKYDNIEVFPSGRFIVSMQTLPAYFSKSERQDEVLDSSNDVKLFGLEIAPRLHITVRFVGEEPIDAITRQYNESMKTILPLFGVQVVEIPRLEKEGKIVSASLVRKLIKNGDIEEVIPLVPEETYEYLLNRQKGRE